MNLREAMCRALVNGWHGDWRMSRVVGHAWDLAEITPDDEIDRYTKAAAAIRVQYIHAADKAQTFIASKLPSLNEALWAGRQTENCVSVALRSLGTPRKGVDVRFVRRGL